MAIAWSLSRDRGPDVWECKAGALSILVHRHHGLEGWFGTCRDLRVDRHSLGPDLEAAKVLLIGILRTMVAAHAEALAESTPRKRARRT